MGRGRGIGALLLAATLGACASIAPPPTTVANPATPPEVGLVALFNGLTLFSEGNQGTGTYTLAENIRRAGVRAEIERPSEWERVADAVLADPGLRAAPIAVYGYSVGAQSAAKFAARLEAAGVPVQTLVTLETYGDLKVPCNVHEGIGLRIGRGDQIAAARPGCARVSNRVFEPTGGGNLNHYSAATDWEVLETAQRELLDGNRVRVRPEG